jgi:hypothetical protein
LITNTRQKNYNYSNIIAGVAMNTRKLRQVPVEDDYFSSAGNREGTLIASTPGKNW